MFAVIETGGKQYNCLLYTSALDLTRRAAHEKKLGKQGLCPAFPER